MIDHAVKTRRLTINAAFMKDIKDDNHQLKSLLDQITPLTAHYQTAINHWPELIQLIDALRDQLALHFALEEAYGYFDDAIGTEPQLSAIAVPADGTRQAVRIRSPHFRSNERNIRGQRRRSYPIA